MDGEVLNWTVCESGRSWKLDGMRNWTVFKSGQSQNSNVDRPKGNDSTNIKSTVKMDGHESERSRRFDFAISGVWSDIFIYIRYDFQYVFTCISLKTTQVQTPFKILPTCEIQKNIFSFPDQFLIV